MEWLAECSQDDFDGLMGHYARHPADWISDWGWTFDPRAADVGRPTTMPFVLFPRQREAVDWIVDRWRSRQDGLIEKSRDMGVTWICVGLAAWFWTFEPGSVVGFGSRKEDLVDKLGDPDSILWRVRFFIASLPRRMRPKGYDEAKHAPFMRIINPATGSVIRGEAGDNIGRGGRATLYIKDESAHYEHPESVDAALSQTTNCQIDVSTPAGEGNPFWRKRHGGRVPVFVFDWRDDPRKSQAWYDRQVATRDPVTVAQEIDRDYGAAISNSFITGAVVTTAMSKGPADVPAVGDLRVGVDVARFGNDKTCITFRRGRVVVRQETWGKSDLMSTAGRVRQMVNAYRDARQCHIEQIAVDTIGVGAGVADALREWFGDAVVDVDSSARIDDGKSYNLRAYMWAQMREWLASASLPNDHDLRADLCGLRYSYRGGLLLLESKDEAKKRGVRSPDRGDSLALTFAKPGTAKKPRPSIPTVRLEMLDAELGL